jgi:hypothetical protein
VTPAASPSPRPLWVRDPELRVGDADRSRVVDLLSQHYTEGRLDATELKERIDRAMGAKTRGQLASLLADLPPIAPPPPPPPRLARRVLLWGAAALALVAVLVPWQAVGLPWLPRVPWVVIGLFWFVLWRGARRRRRLTGPR